MSALRSPPRWVTHDRWHGLVPIAAVVASLGVGLWLVPGAGTAWPGPMHRADVMLPGCGLTRASVALLGADLARAGRYNPAAFLVVPAAGVLLLRWLVGRATSRWLDIDLRMSPRLVAVAVVLVAALWGRQQANFDLLAVG